MVLNIVLLDFYLNFSGVGECFGLLQQGMIKKSISELANMLLHLPQLGPLRPVLLRILSLEEKTTVITILKLHANEAVNTESQPVPFWQEHHEFQPLSVQAGRTAQLCGKTVPVAPSDKCSSEH